MLSDCECVGQVCGMDHELCKRGAVVQALIHKLKAERRLCLACGFSLILAGLAIKTAWKR